MVGATVLAHRPSGAAPLLSEGPRRGAEEIRWALALTPGEVERIARRAAELPAAGRAQDRPQRYMTVLEAADDLRRASRQRAYDLLSRALTRAS